MAKTPPVLEESELNHCLPQISKTLLTASCLSRPSDPIQFLKNTLVALYGHDHLQDVDWRKFVADVEQCTASSLTRRTMGAVYLDPDDMLSFSLLEKAYCCYRKSLTSSCFR